MSNPVINQFAENLLIARRRAGVSQEEVGYLAGLHRTEIGQLERAIRDPRMTTLIKLSGALKVTPNDLLVGIAWRPKSNAPLQGKFHVKER
jgi:transcriptional regulator with XRE-family HTH domain